MTFSTTGCLLFSDKGNALSRAELAPAGVLIPPPGSISSKTDTLHTGELKKTICTLSGLLTGNSHRSAAPGNYSPGSSHCLHFHFDCWHCIVLPHLPKKVGKREQSMPGLVITPLSPLTPPALGPYQQTMLITLLLTVSLKGNDYVEWMSWH